MNFIVDKQTLNDLNIFGKGGRNCIYSLFNRTHTRGGALILEDMFRYPLTDADKINKRSTTIRYFLARRIEFTFQGEWFDTIEHYLSNTDKRTRLAAEENTLQRKIKGYIGSDTDYELLHKGVIAGIGIINCTVDLIAKVDTDSSDNPYREEFGQMKKIVQDPNLAWALREKGVKKLSYAKMVEYDRLFRYEGNSMFKKLLYHIYNMDVYISVAEVAEREGFVFGKALLPGKNVLKIDGVYHPLLKGAVPNTIHVDGDNNVIFLTGANMAGKSTFMKSFGIVIFLAHMGFPLPAKSMEFTVQNGMYTTINLPDNLSMGYSHFYAEVLRVKKVAESVGRSQNLIVIFDELFRGTNVKDAYDATVAIAEAFAENRNCTFMISTHIIEAGEELKKRCDNINFVYLPTIMSGSIPTYTYTLESGITNDRHGMVIVNNERIVEILENGISE